MLNFFILDFRMLNTYSKMIYVILKDVTLLNSKGIKLARSRHHIKILIPVLPYYPYAATNLFESCCSHDIIQKSNPQQNKIASVQGTFRNYTFVLCGGLEENWIKSSEKGEAATFVLGFIISETIHKQACTKCNCRYV